MRTNKIFKLSLFIGFLISIIVILTACDLYIAPETSNNADYDNLADTPDGDTRIIVGIHDAVNQSEARSQTQNIQSLILAVRQIVIIDSRDNHIVILDEERSIDILGVSRSDPVVLSNVSVEPGTYKELRLVLSGNSTIQVAGETYPIRVPSGEQSGLKLKGPFDIPRGKLFSLMIELNIEKSVSWNNGQGYRLSPVLRISNGPNVLGIFRGNYTISGFLGACETLLQLNDDQSARLRVADYPNYTIHAYYFYNSVSRELRLTNIRLDAPGLRRRELKEVMKRLPNEIVFPVRQWSLDNIIAVDTNGFVCNLYRVDDFNFSDGVSFTEFTLNIDYPNSSATGKDVVTEINFIDNGMPPITNISTMEGNRTTLTITVLNNHIQGSSTRVQITSYLFDNSAKLNVDPGIYGSRFVPFMMSGSHFSETTANPWQPPDIFTLRREENNQEFTISFPQSMNIRFDHQNFSTNNPVVRWNPYPGANGYLIMVIVQEKNKYLSSDTFSGSELWAVAFYDYTNDTSITIYSEQIIFTTIIGSGFAIEPNIKSGDFVRIEVYALDGSGAIDTRTKTGALAMDSYNFIR